MDEKQIVCVANAYQKKYYLGSSFERLPTQIKEELQIACVLFTHQVGGILTLSFDDDENLYLHTTASEDPGYDEIGSGLKINQFKVEKKELLIGIERYYREVVKGER